MSKFRIMVELIIVNDISSNVTVTVLEYESYEAYDKAHYVLSQAKVPVITGCEVFRNVIKLF